MSDSALIDLDVQPGSERENDSSSKGSFTGNTVENVEEQHRKNSPSLASTPVNGHECANPGRETSNSEIEYTESENLSDVEDVDTSVETLLAGLDSKDWVLVCESLNNFRRLSIFHKEVMLDALGDVILLIVKSLKNPRSAVCKTAIMTSADLFHAYGDCMIESLDPLLVQLLLKSSQDKRFVCEAAEKALAAMTTGISPNLLLPKLQPHLKNKNPRIRAKASMCFCQSVPYLGVEGINSYGIDKLIQLVAPQLSDRLPESREAARTLLLKLQTVYEKSHELTLPMSDNRELGSWEHFCQSKLSPLSAQAVLRVTNIAREGVIRES
ncbi:hypothetical protein K2173_013795 [Erythroxylum novogranatense]|uniref:TOG domain-containing protein n=1 Tax=Erythroxylum novogranatense TaxID=1862640 RepID=A0AAV8SD35_9ROSI|nr:hypothetical protein K2173_013795 [Erythroxylum novogranatense]